MINGDAPSKPEDDAVFAAENEGMDEAVGHPHARAPNPLAEQVTALEKERDELKDNMLRALAETDNVRKRANRQIEDARIYAVEKFARDLLNVSDNLSRAVAAIPPGERALLTEAARNALDGVEMTQKELVAVLARHGVTAIDASPGAAFDPALHQAVTQIPSNHPAGSVAELFQAGWRIGDRTLRAAMVAVSAGGGSVN
ncbi:MAG: nucleotide exchange factor GrpE [Hyphomonadaceae bacterium]|nr:nucleotide exchange factor GrpE [Hyphomonadaceae bacterium]